MHKNAHLQKETLDVTKGVNRGAAVRFFSYLL